MRGRNERADADGGGIGGSECVRCKIWVLIIAQSAKSDWVRWVILWSFCGD